MAVAHRGAISFGLVHIPVGIYTATQDNDIHFNQLCKEDGSRVRYKKVCSNCGKEVSSGDIVRGFEYEKGKYVTLTDEEFEKAKSEKDRTIHILHFADLKGIRPIYFDKTDHAVPDSGILIETLFFADEIRQAPKEPARPELKEEELTMAKSLISTMVQEFEPEKYHDEYQTRIWEIIRQKIQGEAFDSPDYIYELKLDGIRCIAYLDENGTDLRNKRDMRLLDLLLLIFCIMKIRRRPFCR